MPVITAQDTRSINDVELTFTTLAGDTTDTFTFNDRSGGQLLILRNDTGAPVSVTMIGDAAPATFTCKTYGEIDVEPVAFDVPANGYQMQYLNNVSGVLAGLTTITGGTGLSAAILNQGS